MAEQSHTPGPWAWMGGPHGLYLATTHSGRRYVMGFRRMGFSSAQPAFLDGDRIVPASEVVEFEVGDKAVRGFHAAKADDTVYRYDVSGIDNANARLIAAAPELLEALECLMVHTDGIALPTTAQAMRQRARAAIAKATGGSV